VFDLETYYRATKYGVARHLNCGLQEAQRRIDEAWGLFPGLYDWEQRVIYEAKKDGYITTLMGRRIKIDELDSPNSWKREAAERRCMNNLAQASLQECTKAAMIGIHKAGINILLQVYDDILIESLEQTISSDMETMIEIMENITLDSGTSTITLSIPMKVDSGIGYDWSQC
jgi:DNA polymerase-1